MNKILYKISALMLGGFMAFGQTGKVGIGTTSPTASLHVNTNNPYILRLEDGINTDTSNYTIVSGDTNGTFQKVGTEIFRTSTVLPLPIAGAEISTAYNASSPTWQTTGVKITIPPGKWNLNGWMLLKPSIDITTYGDVGLVCRFTIADNATSTSPSTDLIGVYPNAGSGYFLGKVVAPIPQEVASGIIFVNNSGTAPKDYYFIANIERDISTHTELNNISFVNFGSSTFPQNQYYVMPINDN